MILTFENIAHYLLGEGLITLPAIVDGNFSVRDISSRNCNFVINKEFPDKYLVKQVRMQDAEKTHTMRIEATCYWLANNDPHYQVLKDFLPKYYKYDYLNHILIIELLPNTFSLQDYYSSSQRFPTEIGQQLGASLAAYHTSRADMEQKSKSLSLFQKKEPWIFELIRNYQNGAANKGQMRPVEQQLFQLIFENPTFVDLLKSVTEEWEVESLIHGDIKFPNFLINTSFQQGAELDIRLIDWELADIGDPLWDVAAIFQNYLSFWVHYGKENNSTHSHTIELHQLQPTVATFWNSYVANRNWSKEAADQQLEKAIRFTALKLIHTCFEATPHAKHLPKFCAQFLQLSLNLLQYPQATIEEILGIPTTKYHAVYA
ncbi:MAG: phosphotransferase [Bacteroidota bacterium]